MLQPTQQIATGGMDLTLDQIQAQLSGMYVTQSTGGSRTADGTEQTLYYDNEPLGVFCPICLIVDLDNMLAGDTVVVKIYHRMSDAGTLKLLRYRTWTGADGGLTNGEVLDTVECYPNRHGFRVTLQQTAGTNRVYPWELYLGV